MSRQIRTPDGVVHNFPDEATDAQISKALAPKQDAEQAPSLLSRAKALAQNPTAMAMAGGTAASLATGGLAWPAAMGLVALGGAGGAGYGLAARQTASGAPEPVANSLKTMAFEGAGQAAGEGTGRAMLAGAAKAAPWLMAKSVDMVEALKREFPDAADTMLKYGLSVSKAGREKAKRLMSASRAEAMAKVDQVANQASTSTPWQVPQNMITSHEIADAIQQVGKNGKSLEEELGNRALKERALAQLSKLRSEFLASHSEPMTLQKVQALKETQQDLSEKAYAKARRNQSVVSVTDMFNKAIASGARKALEDRVPGLAEQNAMTQSLMGAHEAIDHAIERRGFDPYRPAIAAAGAAAGGIGGMLSGGDARDEMSGAAIGGILGEIAGSKGNMSRAALALSHPALSNPAVQTLLRQLPRSLASAVEIAISHQQEPQP